MNRTTFTRNIYAVLSSALMVIASSILITVVHASPLANNVGLRVSPLRSYPVQKRGETTSAFVKLSNLTGGQQTVILSSEQFRVTNEDYDYSFESSPIANWVQFNRKTITLPANKTQTASYNIAVPADAEPGGYYITIIASTESQANSTKITELKRVASLIYLEVSGAITHSTNFLSLDIPWLTTSNTPPINVRISNEGNVHDRARLGITARYWFGGKVITSTQMEGLTLPHTIRRLMGSLTLPNVPGFYKLQASLAPPQGGIIEKTHYILYLPLWFVLFVMAIFSALISRFVLARRKH